MGVTSIRRWHWMVIGLLVGALYGYVRESSADFYRELASYGGRRLGQREFEAALTTRLNGRAQFSDLVVYPRRLSGAGGPPVMLHVVSGLYWGGRKEVENGRTIARLEPAYFVASTPYVPLPSPVAASPGTPSGPAQFADVTAFLRSPRNGSPVPFRYAWWSWATRPPFAWTCAGFLFVGVVWPTVVNLLAFGTFRRPAEAKGLSLWNAKPAPSPKVNRAEAVRPDAAALEAIERELEAASSESPPPSPSAMKPAVRAFRGGAPDQSAVVAEEAKQKDYGADEEDYYPTELKAKHGE
jgi:hypothetical protein